MHGVTKIKKILPIHVIKPQVDKENSLSTAEELESLIATLGGEIVDRIIQKLERPDSRTYIGQGKIAEVLQKVEEHNVDIVILNAMAKPGQIHNLKSQLQKVNPEIDVWDRIDLILHIFDKHATTTEAKLQIELARMRYMGPRIYGMGFVMSRQGGGIGTTGIGETNTERMRRHWRNEVKRIKDQIDKISKGREAQLEQRKRAGFKTVSIVGYTNAGKSSLFNVFTKKNMLVQDVLFATLDSSVGKLYIPEMQEEVLITDTIGFIRNLPPQLIDAFKSTLLESINADLLLHVIDVSDPEKSLKMQVVSEILAELGLDNSKVIYVFNKIDAATKEVNLPALKEKFTSHSPQFISVRKMEGIEGVLAAIAEYFVNNG